MIPIDHLSIGADPVSFLGTPSEFPRTSCLDQKRSASGVQHDLPGLGRFGILPAVPAGFVVEPRPEDPGVVLVEDDPERTGGRVDLQGQDVREREVEKMFAEPHAARFARDRKDGTMRH